MYVVGPYLRLSLSCIHVRLLEFSLSVLRFCVCVGASECMHVKVRMAEGMCVCVC